MNKKDLLDAIRVDETAAKNVAQQLNISWTTQPVVIAEVSQKLAPMADGDDTGIPKDAGSRGGVFKSIRRSKPAPAAAPTNPRKPMSEVAEAWWETAAEAGIAILAIIGMFLVQDIVLIIFVSIGVLALIVIFGPMIARRVKEKK